MKSRQNLVTILLLTISLFGATNVCFAYDEIVTKHEFELANFTTESGKTLRDVRVGYES